MTTNWTLSRGNAVTAGFSGRSSRKRFTETIREWIQRARSRRELARLSHLELKDLPNQDMIYTEKRKTFWRA